MTEKYLKEQLKKFYIQIFLDNDFNYIKKDIRTYADYDDYKKVYYISDEYSLRDGVIKFRIKQSSLRYLLDVETSFNDCHIILYHDIFKLKKRNKIKDKIIKIIDETEYKIICDRGGVEFGRRLKLLKLKK